MTSPDDRPYHHGDLRRVIIDTAIAMLDEPAGPQFTLREVARRAGVSHAAPYKHFPDKAALLTEIALIGFERLREALAAGSAGAPPGAVPALVGMARAYLEFGASNPALYRLMFGAGMDRSLHLSGRAMGAFDEVIGLLERGQAEGVIRPRPVRGQAAACWAQMHGLTLLALDGLLLPEKVGDGAVDAALSVLLEGLAVDPARWVQGHG
ncbi:TetR/AcrR family transcriptional regulator [Paracoccus lutimaris]|uniref:TetR family transcriptional regulator n=1 Tax=Paracoccus lutimaris TaxID=1490030 RepID=A0A368Z487_9RHOB|nr:TetR/AcrR family transcriptional regulator [Paracoccus lutimaris]RCW87231.1 TetR family transcriptional regulator [Paracoccus lutimaris]